MKKLRKSKKMRNANTDKQRAVCSELFAAEVPITSPNTALHFTFSETVNCDGAGTMTIRSSLGLQSETKLKFNSALET